MSNFVNKRTTPRRQIALLTVLLILCAGAWGFNFWRQASEAPLRGHLEAGRRAIEQGQGGAAETEWRAALALNPQSAETWELLGDYYTTVGNWPQSREAFQKLAALEPTTPRAWSRLGMAAAHLEDEKTVIQATKEALRHDANDVEALALQATLLVRAEKWDEQADVLRRLVQLQPENVNYTAQLADALTALGKFDEARPLLTKLIKEQPDFAPAYAIRGEGTMREGATPQQLAQAESDLKKSLELDGTQEKARTLLAELYVRLGNTPQAIVQYQELVAQHPDKAIYLNALANVYMKSGARAQALALRRRVARITEDRDRKTALNSRLANDPKDFQNNLQMGLLLLRSPQPLNADKYIEKAARLRPADKSAQAAARELETLYQGHLQAGLSALKKGDIKTADHEISRAMLLRPRDARTSRAVQMVTQAAQIQAAKQ